MPTKQGGRALKNASTSDRCSFHRNTALPAASTAWSWRTRLAMSKPTVVISIVDGSFNSLLLTARAWHIDAVRGRPPHQILPATRRDARERSDRRAQFPGFPLWAWFFSLRSGPTARSWPQWRRALASHDYRRDGAL